MTDRWAAYSQDWTTLPQQGIVVNSNKEADVFKREAYIVQINDNSVGDPRSTYKAKPKLLDRVFSNSPSPVAASNKSAAMPVPPKGSNKYAPYSGVFGGNYL